jgi:hypothetical protein
MDHDRLFKDLLTTFFVEFIDLFFPKMAAELDRDSIEFLDKEIFPDINTGDRHEVDLLAKVRLSGRETFILIHVENQSTWQANFPKRMFNYFARLHAKFDLPVFPIALFSYDRPFMPASQQYEIDLFGQPILKFQFQVIQLNRLNWKDFLANPNPVANALMARMKIAVADRVQVKLECLRMLATLKLDPARTDLIGGFMNSYLKLSDSELVLYNQGIKIFTPEEKEVVMEVINEWKIMERMELVLFQLTCRFGELPHELSESVHQLTGAQVRELAAALLKFDSLADAQAWIAHARLT